MVPTQGETRSNNTSWEKRRPPEIFDGEITNGLILTTGRTESGVKTGMETGTSLLSEEDQGESHKPTNLNLKMTMLDFCLNSFKIQNKTRHSISLIFFFSFYT